MDRQREGMTMEETETRSLVFHHFGHLAKIHEEVWMTHPSGEKCRIDFVLETEWPDAPRLAFFGIEVKGDGAGRDDDSDALRQCVDYMACTTNDYKRPAISRRKLTSVFMMSPSTLTCWRDEDKHFQYWYGASRLASRFGVGLITMSPYHGICLEMPVKHILWKASKGVTGIGSNYGTNYKIGNHRKTA